MSSDKKSEKSVKNEKFKSKDISKQIKSKNNVKKQKNKTEKQKQMDIVLNARKKGKTREEAAKLAGIPLYKIIHWYKEGKQGFGKDNVKFYNQLKKIENKLLNSKDSNERKQMEFVLKLFKKGKTKSEVAKLTELNESTITSWYNQGKDKRSTNTIYFYNEMNKIKKESEPSTVSNEPKIKSQSHKRDLVKERKQMDSVLNSLREGKTKREASSKANVPLSKVLNWEYSARFGNDENVTYFYNELKKIPSKPKRNNLNNTNNDFKKSTEKNHSHVKKVKVKTKLPDYESAKKDENDLNDEREIMNSVLSLMRKGHSRVKAAQEVGIKVGQIIIWYTQGRKNYSENTVYFYNQLNLIEKK